MGRRGLWIRCPSYPPCEAALMTSSTLSLQTFNSATKGSGVSSHPNSCLISSAQSFSRVQLFPPPCTAAHQGSLSITNSQSLRTLMSFESVMPSNHLILCRPLLLLPSTFPNHAFLMSWLSLIKKLFSSSSLSAIMVVSSAYLLFFLPPFCWLKVKDTTYKLSVKFY